MDDPTLAGSGRTCGARPWPVQQLQFLQVQGLQRQPPFALQLQVVFWALSIVILLLSNSGQKG